MNFILNQNGTCLVNLCQVASIYCDGSILIIRMANGLEEFEQFDTIKDCQTAYSKFLEYIKQSNSCQTLFQLSCI